MRMTNRINKIINNLNTDTDGILPIPKGVDFIEHMEDSKSSLRNEISDLSMEIDDCENTIEVFDEEVKCRKEMIEIIDELIEKKSQTDEEMN